MTDATGAGPGSIGRFDLLDRIAIGGMAEVFVACERGKSDLGRLVVIKRILPHLVMDQAFVAMFLQEARIAARIQHPNVVQIYELGEQGGFPFIAMEYVPGSTLRELSAAAEAQGRKVPVGVAIDLLAQACEGVHAAHRLTDDSGRAIGVVHRDLSPHNLIVTPDGHLKLLDFGIAKASEGMDKTRTGVLKGTISYLSPEQCRQHDVDLRSDLFTLGIVLWEMLAGEKLFHGPSDLGTMQRIVSGEHRDLRSVRPEVPDAVVEVVDRALALDPNGRFDSAEAMRAALRRAAASAGVATDRQEVRVFVGELLGDTHEARRSAVGQAVERTLSMKSAAPASPRRPWAVLVAAAAAGALLVAAVTAGVWVWAAGFDQEPDFEGSAVHVGLAPTIDGDVLLSDLEPVRRYLQNRLHREVIFDVADSYHATSAAVIDGTWPFAFLPPYTYLKAHEADPGIQVLAIKVYEDSSGSDSVLLVPESSVARTAADLRGARICHSDPSSTTSYILPRAWLRARGIDPDVDLGERHFSGNHLQVIRDVASGRCDVGGTYTGAYLSAQEAGVQVSRTRVLGVAGRTPHDAVVAGRAVDPELTRQFQQALLAFDPLTEVGASRIGTVERISGFAEASDADYQSLRDALAAEPPPPTPQP